MTTRGRAADPMRSNYSFAVDDDRARVEGNRARLAGNLGFDAARFAINRQVHGDRIVVVADEYVETEGDGLVTDRTGWLLGASVADCVPILLYDRKSHAVGAIHSGWRGTAAEVLPRGIEAMTASFGTSPEDLLVWVGPAAGACCYEVREDVVSAFDPSFSREIGEGRYLFDNRAAILAQLRAARVPSGSVEVDIRCTICDERFHSWRREGKSSGRMLAVIGLLRGSGTDPRSPKTLLPQGSQTI